MTQDTYFKKIGVKDADDYIQQCRDKLNHINKKFGFNFKSFEEFLKYYDQNVKGINIAMFVTKPDPVEFERIHREVFGTQVN